jgi:hypothetical protein
VGDGLGLNTLPTEFGGEAAAGRAGASSDFFETRGAAVAWLPRPPTGNRYTIEADGADRYVVRSIPTQPESTRDGVSMPALAAEMFHSQAKDSQ